MAVSNGCLIDSYFVHQNATIIMENNLVYNCTLNQTDIKDNKNKYYIMQLLCVGTTYYHFIRYGRIGEPGKVIEKTYTDKRTAMTEFAKQFKSKTGNTFGTPFQPKEGKYYMSEIDYEFDTPEKKDVEKKDAQMLVPITKQSQLPDRLQYLLSLISDTTMMNNMLVSLDIDAQKMPLGKISKQQLNLAYNVLKNISDAMNSGNMTTEFIRDCSNEFYRYIPIACGRSVPPLINTTALLGKYCNLIDELGNMVIATTILESKQDDTIHHLDTIYHKLGVDIVPLDESDIMFSHIRDYVYNTQSGFHKKKAQLLDIFEINRHEQNYTTDIPNKQLLFHGSRMSNFCSILQKGLILNPESLGVPIAGKMFGYGIYGANSNSKSRQYCDTGSSNKIGAMLLCEFALGNQYKCVDSQWNLNKDILEKQKCHSTWGMGTHAPGSSIVVNDVIIPNGPLEKTKIDSVLLHDEFIVYDTNQIKFRYLILFKE